MTADERLFSDQSDAFPNLRVLAWIDPAPRESLTSYALRLSNQIKQDRPFIIGGCSFGGIVALEFARHVPALACVLIASVRSPGELPKEMTRFRIFATLGPGFLRTIAWFALCLGKYFLPARQVRSLRRLSQSESAFERWAICALLKWKPIAPGKTIPIYQIHGANDRVFPVALTHPDVVVAGGDHALPLSHPSAVNEFIDKVIQETNSFTRE